MNREILNLAIPNILTNLTVPLVSLVDVALMGRLPSPYFILAIGYGTIIFNFLYWGFGFLRMGTTGLVAQAHGKADPVLVERWLGKGLLVSFTAGVLLVLIHPFILKLGLAILQPEQAVINPLEFYFNIRILAAPAAISVFVLTGWLLGRQNARAALLIAVVINLLNALISYVMVRKLHFSIQGVAIGSVIAQYAGLLTGIIIIILSYQIHIFKAIKQGWRDRGGWLVFVKLNREIFIRTLALMMVMSFFKAKAAGIDPLIGAANILLFEFITISAYGIDGFAFAAESICGKYFGEENTLRLKRAIRLSFYWGIGLAGVLALGFFLFGEPLLALLTNKAKLINIALTYLPWLVVAPLVNAWAFIWDGIYVGLTAGSLMRNAMLLSVGLFISSFLLFSRLWENHGMWAAFTLFMLSRGVIQSIWANKLIRINH